jgi:hypothetical protein
MSIGLGLKINCKFKHFIRFNKLKFKISLDNIWDFLENSKKYRLFQYKFHLNTKDVLTVIVFYQNTLRKNFVIHVIGKKHFRF